MEFADFAKEYLEDIKAICERGRSDPTHTDQELTEKLQEIVNDWDIMVDTGPSSPSDG